jgi:hypothetical protein
MIFSIKNMKYMISKKYYLHILILISTLAISFLPINKQIEISRFYILKNGYNSLATQLAEKIESNGEIGYGELNLHFPHQLITLNNDKVFYLKNDSDVVISITVSKSFFVHRSFVYFSSLESKELIEKDNKYDSIEWLEYPNWAYIKWY